MSEEREPARTGFWQWWMAQGRGGLSDVDLEELCRELDPDGLGLCDRQVRRIRNGELHDAQKYWLLCQITGLTLEDFLEPQWLEAARARLPQLKKAFKRLGRYPQPAHSSGNARPRALRAQSTHRGASHTAG